MSSIAFSSDTCQHSYPRRTASFAWKISKKKFLSYNYYLFTFENLHISRFRRQIIIFDPSRNIRAKKFSSVRAIFRASYTSLRREREREEKMKEKLADFFQPKMFHNNKGDKSEMLRFKNRERNYSTRHQNGSRYHNRDNNEAFYGKRGWDEQKNSPRIIRFHSVEFRLTLYTRFLQMIKFCLFYASPCF